MKDGSSRPNVKFRRKLSSIENLRWQVKWCSFESHVIWLVYIAFNETSESKVWDFEHVIVDHDILWLHISMDYFVLLEMLEAFADLLE